MKVIFLDGPSSSGKTTTLKKLYEYLKSTGAQDILPVKICPLGGYDIECYISFNGKKIGIVSIGDYALETVFYLGIFFERGADILVIANSKKEFPYTIVSWHEDILEQIVIQKQQGANDDDKKVQQIISHL